MSLIKYFWTDPYATEHHTHITHVDLDIIQVQSTIFFAFSGGQESDAGTIGNWQVKEAIKQDQIILYRLPPDHTLKVGDAVKICIDGDRRYALMKLHFAAELVLEMICRQFPDIQRIGSHIAQDKSRIDFVWPEPFTPLLPELTAAVQEIIQADLAIHCQFFPDNVSKRYWEIDGFAKVPCGGTHIRSTKEIGNIRLKRKNIGQNKERIEIYLA